MFFNFLKSKPTMRELIPDGFVDIHSHILPGIDDGSKNVKESIYLISEMKKLGFSKIIGTPHSYPGLYDNTKESIKTSFKKLKKELPENINIDYASEYLIDSSLINKINDKSILCLKDNYVLVEMSFLYPPINLYEIVFELSLKNYIPIIAHPERYLYFNNNKLKEITRLRNMRCKFQINLLSVVGLYGKEVTRFCDTLLKANMIDFVGSDVHNKYHLTQFEKKIKISQIDKLKSCIENNKIFY